MRYTPAAATRPASGWLVFPAATLVPSLRKREECRHKSFRLESTGCYSDPSPHPRWRAPVEHRLRLVGNLFASPAPVLAKRKPCRAGSGLPSTFALARRHAGLTKQATNEFS